MPQLLTRHGSMRFPSFSPDGTKVLGGNGSLRYIDLINNNSIVQVTFPGAGFLRGGWADNETILIQNTNGNNWLYQWRDGVAKSYKQGKYGGNAFRASHNFNYAACVNGIRLHYNDTELGDKNFDIDLYGTTLVANHNNEKSIRVWHDGVFFKDYTPLTPPFVVRASIQGYIGYGYSGKSAIIRPDGSQLLVNLVPAETPGKVVLAPDNKPWVITSTDDKTYMRPLGHTEKTAIIFDSGAVRLDAIGMGSNVLVACDLNNSVCSIFEASFSEALVPITVEPPGPNPMPIPNHLDVVKAARVKYNSLSGAERAGKIVNQVAWDLKSEGAGTFFKNSGDNYNDRSIDVIIYKPNGETFDILGDAEGSANPQWARTQPTGFGDVSKWRAASNPDDTGPTPPNPTDPARDLLRSIENQIKEFFGET